MPRMTRALLAMFLVTCSAAVTMTPRAAVADDARAKREARKLLTKGDRALQRGDRLARRKKTEQAAEQYREALNAYKKAYEVYPQPQIYFAIGNAEEKLGRFVDAHSHYRRLIEEADDPSDKLRAAVEARIDSVLQNLTVVTFTAKPDGSTIFLDEQEIGSAPLSEPLILEPGPHRISVRKEGHTPGADQFVAKAGTKLERKVVLKKIPKVEDAPPPPPPPPPKELGPPPGRWILISSLVGRDR
ncbi:MAG: PEGA domain-containing protein [Deltaproteobacteria bacterium]|nr:PEGA domain-containing protein [Deltaproteobacteria bacterium]